MREIRFITKNGKIGIGDFYSLLLEIFVGTVESIIDPLEKDEERKLWEMGFFLKKKKQNGELYEILREF
jgi:hypothetical protein